MLNIKKGFKIVSAMLVAMISTSVFASVPEYNGIENTYKGMTASELSETIIVAEKDIYLDDFRFTRDFNLTIDKEFLSHTEEQKVLDIFSKAAEIYLESNGLDSEGQRSECYMDYDITNGVQGLYDVRIQFYDKKDVEIYSFHIDADLVKPSSKSDNNMIYYVSEVYKDSYEVFEFNDYPNTAGFIVPDEGDLIPLDKEITRDRVNAVYDLYSDGKIVGDGLGNLRPYDDITKAELSVILNRVCGFKMEKAINEYKDIEGHWAEEDIKIADSNLVFGLTMKDLFVPNDTLTIGEFEVILQSAFGKVVDTKYMISENVTRIEAIEFIYKYMN